MTYENKAKITPNGDMNLWAVWTRVWKITLHGNGGTGSPSPNPIEVLDGTSFKWWKNQKEIDADYLKEEVVDIFHFFVSMCLRLGMDADELFERYLTKNRENFDRQHGKSAKPGYDPRELTSQ